MAALDAIFFSHFEHTPLAGDDKSPISLPEGRMTKNEEPLILANLR